MSIGAEVALATSASPHAGEQRVVLSRRLREDLPLTLAALGRGELTEDRAFAVAREVAHLTAEQRGRVDEDVAHRLVGLGDVRLRQAVRRSCLTHAAESETRRYTRARADRRVTTRGLDDGTGQVTATVPLEVMAAIRAALDAATARAAGDARTGGQVRADTLAARITGHGSSSPATDPAEDLDVRVNLVIGIESLFGEGTEPGLIPGVGFLPAALCTRLVARACAAAKATLRRLFVTPTDRALVAMESTSRRFEGLLAEFLDLRDGGLCRTTGCNAAIRHHDHITPVAEGGITEATNGQGLCERCNYLKETPGWTSWVADPGDTTSHTVHGVTEHLRLHHSTAPPMPGGPAGAVDYSPIELRVARHFTLIS